MTKRVKIKKIKVKKTQTGHKPSHKATKIIKRMKAGYMSQRKQNYARFGPVGGSSSKETYMFSSEKETMAAPAVTQKVIIKEAPGIEISVPKVPAPLSTPLSSDEKEMLRNVNVTYPLIPEQPKRNEKVYAYARIRWDPKRNEIVYSVIEPDLTEYNRKVVEVVKKELEERLDIDFMKIGEIRAKELLSKEIRDIISDIEGVDPSSIDTIQYYVKRDIIGLGKIEPFMCDHDIEDISCDGEKIPIYIYHRNPLFGSIMSNIIFEDSDDLNTFAMKLSQKCGKSISVAEPIVEGALPDGSRVHAILGTDIARRGSNFTIRKFTKIPLTPIHMIESGVIDPIQLAYLWMAIENRKSLLISGGTASGKTSLLNALSLFIRPSMKIVSIEDTPELRLPHPHWIPEVARTAISEGNKAGEVSLYDLLKGSLRQRPDYIIVGEVRGQEALV